MARTHAHNSIPQVSEPRRTASGQALEPLPWIEPAPGPDGKPINLTPKQSAFVVHYLATGNASEAYREAYGAHHWEDTGLRAEACKTLALPNVSKTIRHHREQVAGQYDIDAQTVTGMLMEAYEIGRADGNAGEMRQSAVALAKLHRLDQPEADADDVRAINRATSEAIREVFAMAKAEREKIRATAQPIEAEEWSPVAGNDDSEAAEDDQPASTG